MHNIPMRYEIGAVIFDMIAAEAAQISDETSLDDLWSSVAFDRHGEFRGYGFGHTPAQARIRLGHRLVAPACPTRRTTTVTATWVSLLKPHGPHESSYN
jgi:hypothetical protein